MKKTIEQMKLEIKPGIYSHFKGKEYHVFGIGMHSENYEDIVIYQELFGEHEIWARPLKMFSATVEKDGIETPRFRYVREYNGE